MALKSTDIPRYQEFILPVIKAVHELGGSAKGSQVVDKVIADFDPSDEMLAVTFPNRPWDSVLRDRILWGRSYAKLIGALESPKRGVFLLTQLGRQLLSLPEDEATKQVLELDRKYRRERSHKPTGGAASVAVESSGPVEEPASEEPDSDLMADEPEADTPQDWKATLLARLHQLTPDGFEEFVLFLLRLYDLELERVGGPGDGGIDGIGTAPISPVLSSRVAVQIKRYDPGGRPIGREVVALFQRDASARGAERAILVTLGRFSEKARGEATAMTPTVDLIDGDRLAQLILEKTVGVRLAPVVDIKWFDRFD